MRRLPSRSNFNSSSPKMVFSNSRWLFDFPKTRSVGFVLLRLTRRSKGRDRAGHAFAIANTAFAANFDFEDAFARRFIGNDGDVSKFEAGGFVRPQAGVGHEKNVVVQVLARRFPAWILRVLSPFAGCFV